jgi:hypothetical protein
LAHRTGRPDTSFLRTRAAVFPQGHCAAAAPTSLRGLRRIDAHQPYAFAGNLNRIAVNDAYCTGQISPRNRIEGGDQHESRQNENTD